MLEFCGNLIAILKRYYCWLWWSLGAVAFKPTTGLNQVKLNLSGKVRLARVQFNCNDNFCNLVKIFSGRPLKLTFVPCPRYPEVRKGRVSFTKVSVDVGTTRKIAILTSLIQCVTITGKHKLVSKRNLQMFKFHCNL